MKNFFMIATNQVIQIAQNGEKKEQHVCSEIVISVMEPEYFLMVPSEDEKEKPKNAFQIAKNIRSETYRIVCTEQDLKDIIIRIQEELECIKKIKVN